MILTDFTLAEAFVEVRTVKGNRYIDLAGQIMNEFEERFGAMQVGLDGLAMAEPLDESDSLRGMRVTTDRIWLHYGGGTEWQTIRQEAPAITERVARLLQVEGYRRRGFRVHLLYPLEDPDKAVAELANATARRDVVSWESLGDLIGYQLALRVESAPVKAQMVMRPIRVLRSPRRDQLIDERTLVLPPVERAELPQTAWLVDTDVYDDRLTTDFDIKPLINHAVEFLSGKLAPFVSRILGEAGA